MTIKPIDVNTNLLANSDASRLRENHKSQEAGQTQLLAQNQNKIQEKFETVNQTEASEQNLIRKEDEAAEREKGQPDAEPKEEKAEETPEEKAPPLPDPKGIRGFKIDLKA